MKSILEAHKEKLKDINRIIDENHAIYFKLYSNFIQYVEEHPSTTYYPLSKIFMASKCEELSHALEVANYFSSGKMAILDITFCYFDFDGNEIAIERESFINSVLHNETPASEETGNLIDDFIPSRLGFYCHLKNIEND